VGFKSLNNQIRGPYVLQRLKNPLRIDLTGHFGHQMETKISRLSAPPLRTCTDHLNLCGDAVASPNRHCSTQLKTSAPYPLLIALSGGGGGGSGDVGALAPSSLHSCILYFLSSILLLLRRLLLVSFLRLHLLFFLL
jgi:hypothetical protein